MALSHPDNIKLSLVRFEEVLPSVKGDLAQSLSNIVEGQLAIEHNLRLWNQSFPPVPNTLVSDRFKIDIFPRCLFQTDLMRCCRVVKEILRNP